MPSSDGRRKDGRREAKRRSESKLTEMKSESAKARKKRHEGKNLCVTLPHSHDVLCGRGPKVREHNKTTLWRRCVDSNKIAYQEGNAEKRLIAGSIIQRVRRQKPPGRFLEKMPDGLWYEIAEKKVFEKTMQALRDDNEKAKKHIENKAFQERVAAEFPSILGALSTRYHCEHYVTGPLKRIQNEISHLHPPQRAVSTSQCSHLPTESVLQRSLSADLAAGQRPNFPGHERYVGIRKTDDAGSLLPIENDTAEEKGASLLTALKRDESDFSLDVGAIERHLSGKGDFDTVLLEERNPDEFTGNANKHGGPESASVMSHKACQSLESCVELKAQRSQERKEGMSTPKGQHTKVNRVSPTSHIDSSEDEKVHTEKRRCTEKPDNHAVVSKGPRSALQHLYTTALNFSILQRGFQDLLQRQLQRKQQIERLSSDYIRMQARCLELAEETVVLQETCNDLRKDNEVLRQRFSECEAILDKEPVGSVFRKYG